MESVDNLFRGWLLLWVIVLCKKVMNMLSTPFMVDNDFFMEVIDMCVDKGR